MLYEDLPKIYYKKPSEYDAIYNNRYNSSCSCHFDIYIKQYNYRHQYPAFLCSTQETSRLIEELYKKQRAFDNLLRQTPDIVLQQYALLSVIDEVKATNEIEGVHSTRRELQEIFEEEKTNSRFFGIISKYEKIIHGERLLLNTPEDIRRIYDDFIYKKVVENNSKNELDGVLFRRESVDITSNSVGKVIHQGANPESKIIDLLEKAINILKDDEISHIERIALFHYLFGYIHPFYDGNGRMARLISSYQIAMQFHYIVAMRLSVTIKRQQKKYYKMFELCDGERARGDLTPFVLGFMELLLNTFDDVLSSLQRKNEQIKIYEKKLFEIVDKKDTLLKSIYLILFHSSLMFGQGVSIEQLMRLTNKSRNTVKNRLDDIPDSQKIIRVIRKKHFYKLNMRIFKDIEICV